MAKSGPQLLRQLLRDGNHDIQDSRVRTDSHHSNSKSVSRDPSELPKLTTHYRTLAHVLTEALMPI